MLWFLTGFGVLTLYYYKFIQSLPGLAQVFEYYCKSFPDSRYFGVYMVFDNTLVVQDPDLIKDITIRDFDHFVDHIQYSPGDEPLWERNLFSLKGDAWRSMRSILSPAFTSSKIKIMFPLMMETTENFINHFQYELQKKSTIMLEMKDIFTRFANDVIASIAYGYSCDSLKYPKNEFYKAAKEIVPHENYAQNIRTYIMFKVPKLAKRLGYTIFSKYPSEFFQGIVKDAIKTRQEEKLLRLDMIHLLLEEKRNRTENNEVENIADVDITAQALAFFFAGVESVSSLMCFTAYELAVNSDIQKRLQKEIDDTLRECDGKITFKALSKMEYIDMVLSETLRKWPSSILTDRVCTKDYEIKPKKPGEVPVWLRKGDIVWIPTFSIQRNPKLFPDPDRFDLERFNKDNKSKMDPYSYTPFGSGPRLCIGNQFALIETKLLFFQILSKFDFVVVQKTQVPLKLAKYYFQLSSEGGFWLGLKLRDSA
ncbi:hypothetical protein FQR65_LT01470 [Abscondita terminalis]|nr:hypothetical protein FQR65_LT01470 [Abscondita terminalis]